ncbi:MAG: hypothetical protein QOE14_1666 [Humisphaera sp.]|nr:hypothetical protein [Humisphaera sp.]
MPALNGGINASEDRSVCRRELDDILFSRHAKGAAMLRYTARNGTTFQCDPTSGSVHVIAADEESGVAVALDLEDMREFLQHLEERLDAMNEMETDADCTAVGPD